MGRVLLGVVGIYQDIIQVHDYRDINHIGEDIIHEPLKTSWGVGEPLGHHQPLERPVSGLECGFPFIAISDTDKVVSVSQVDLCIDSRLAGCIQ